MSTARDQRAARGLGGLTGAALRAASQLDRTFRSWAETSLEAVEYALPPVVPVCALDLCDYFTSFPHLGNFVAPIASDRIEGFARHAHDRDVEEIDPAALEPPRFVLAPSACYALYHHLSDEAIDDPLIVTLVSPCFRRESEYSAGNRQWHFTMREIVCIGAVHAVQRFLDDAAELIRGKLTGAGLPHRHAAATDPFFRADDPKLVLQKLAPVKHEFLDERDVALSSINFHRNFFGERFGIRLTSGEPAFSGCVGFGIDRWASACTRAFGAEPTEWPAALQG